MTRLRVNPERVLPEYLARYLHACWVRGDFTQLANSHVSQASVGRKVLSALPLPLPPISQQQQIVELLDQVDRSREAASASLSQSVSALIDFRRTVLTAACLGRLTEDWREKRPEAEAVGIDKLNSGSRGRRRNTEPGIDFEMPEAPDFYVLAPISASVFRFTYGTTRKADVDATDVPVLPLAHIL